MGVAEDLWGEIEDIPENAAKACVSLAYDAAKATIDGITAFMEGIL